MTLDEALALLGNVGIGKYRVTKNAAFFESADGRKAKATAWDETNIEPKLIEQIKADISSQAIAAESAQPMDIDPRTGRHIDRTAQIARARLRAERKRIRKARLRAVQH